MKINKAIDKVDSINIKDFNKNYFKPQKPLLIKGLADHYPAGKKWTVDYLKELCGDVTVDIFDSNNKDTSSSAFTTPDLKMKFKEYVDTILKDEPSSLRMFLFNMFKCKPELRKDFPCPYMFKGLLGKIGYMFFGSKNTKVRIHQDIDMSNVLLTQFHGRKRVVLISPEFSDLLYRLPFNTYSLVDLDNPDYNKYPGLAYVEADEYILEPGDALYMPSGYWHYITYLDGGFAVSYRKLAASLKMKLIGAFSLTVYMPIDKLLNSIFGKKWLSYKEHIAEVRANKAIIKKILSAGYVIKEEKMQKPYYDHASQLRTDHR
ncbi:MAG: cupin-like domain-containing protein [Bacteroidetes bacterium]|nr:cupin-like domain-containing protein [Bacteroidota bacterium]